MGIFSLFKKKKPLDPPKEVRDVMEKMARMEEGRKLADQAISYRNVGNFNKALELLKRALTDFDYKPAIILIGTTAVLKGDIKNAVLWFELQIKEREKANDFPLIELYANLGSIYHKYYKNHKKALEQYIKALKAPRPSILDEEAYLHMESNVYHDMAIVYGHLDDAMRSRQCAEKCLRVKPDCPVCRKILDHMQVTLNQSGDLTTKVVKDPSGRYKVLFTDKSDINSLVYSIALIAAQELKTQDRFLFCRWAGLPENEWTSSHIDMCALAIMHYICDAKESSSPLPEAVREAARFLTRDRLPDLDRPLSEQVRSLFNRMFGG
ncbi:MAG: hypothetical protein CV087_22240 [Candidatus Brocadia sp. WS118]|nr:MAG: hypothetical protein CV087_22240 [Candidatus Brocadia sp. WS118]